MKNENVLCIKLETIKNNFDLNKESWECTSQDINNMEFHFLPRVEAEKNTSYKQIIPYAILFNKEGKVLSYQRCGSEKRLRGICSVGLGGHVNDNDKNDSLSKTIKNGLCRELEEEVGLTISIDKLELIGMINEDRSEVGLCHIGVVYKIIVNEEDLIFDKEIGTPLWLNCNCLKLTNYELWSTLALRLLGMININTNRTIVSIMSDQLSPNYLFIKELYKEGDKLLFISSKKMVTKLDLIKAMFPKEIEINVIALENDSDEEKWNIMTATIREHLNEKEDYMVNLSGGTKYMALAAMHVFEDFNSRFYYIPFPNNIIIEPMSNDIRELQYRMGVKEYLKLNGREIKQNELLHSAEYSKYFFYLFTTKDLLNIEQLEIIDKLRAYRDKKYIAIDEIENGIYATDKFPAIPGLKSFLEYIKYPIEDFSKLSKYDCRYISGGWFEEYTYYKIEETIKPNNILIGVETLRNDNTNINDLDVVFTYGNKLYIIECKTAVSKEKMLKEIVYKASALKSHLTGIAANSYILSLSPHEEKWATISRNLGTAYYGLEYVNDEQKWDEICKHIIKKSYN